MCSLFPSEAICLFTDVDEAGSAYVAFRGYQVTPSHQRFQPCQDFAHYKEMLAVKMELQDISEPCSIFSDSLYVVNILTHIPQAHIPLDNNPISPIIVALQALLEG